MTDSDQARPAASGAAGGGAAKEVSVSEIDVVQTEPAANPVRKIVLIALIILLVLFVYHVLSDRYTPYTSQARVETFMTQIAPEVAGDVLEVGTKDNSAINKGQLLFRIDPEPYQVAIRSAEANLSVALQAADVSVADVAAAQAQVRKQRVDLAASRQLGKIVTDLVGERALAETQGIRARADIGKTEADVTKPFPFNAFYAKSKAPVVDPAGFRLELSGKIADRRPWSLDRLYALPQTSQISRYERPRMLPNTIRATP